MLAVVKFDAGAHPEFAARYRVAALPTLLLFRDGEVVDRLVGNPGSRGALERWLAPYLGS